MQTDGGSQRAVDKRFITGTTAALRFLLLTNVPSPVCLCKSCACKARPGIEGSFRMVVYSSLEVGTRCRPLSTPLRPALALHRPAQPPRRPVPPRPAVPGFARGMFLVLHFSNPKPGHTTGGSGRPGARRAAGRGRAGQDGMPTGRFAQETTVPLAPSTVEDNCFERPPGSTNKGNPM